MTLTKTEEELQEMGRYYAGQEIRRRMAGGLSEKDATEQLGAETYQLSQQVKDDEGEFAARHRRFLEGVLKRCD